MSSNNGGGKSESGVNTFKLVISSPDGNIFEGDAFMFTVRGIEGELAVLAGHIPFVTVVKPCDCKIEMADCSERMGHTEGGILTVSRECTTLLSGSFKFTD